MISNKEGSTRAQRRETEETLNPCWPTIGAPSPTTPFFVLCFLAEVVSSSGQRAKQKPILSDQSIPHLLLTVNTNMSALNAACLSALSTIITPHLLSVLFCPSPSTSSLSLSSLQDQTPYYRVQFLFNVPSFYQPNQYLIFLSTPFIK